MSIFQSLFDDHDHDDIQCLRRLDEFTVKDISKIVNPNDLPHRDYEPLLKQVKYQETKQNICKFLVMNNYNGWETYIRFLAWDEQIRDTSLKATEVANLLMWSGDVQFYCKCPAFKFWGMQYICTQLGISIVPENRFPYKRNPQLKGILCKHERKMLKTLPFYTGDIAKAINQQRQALGIKYQPKG